MELDDRIPDASKTIFNFCKAKTASTADAEDLSQEILLELCRSVHDLRNEAAFYGFMWSVANNVYKQWLRKRKREPAAAALDESLADPAFDVMPEEDENVALLRRELGLLNREYRRAVILYYMENRSCSEISRLLGISESMVKYLLFKSRKKLREGMSMERTYGEKSYHPKSLKLMFWFWQAADCRYYHAADSKIAQNILFACCNDELKAEQISLEIGVALPYMEDDLEKLLDVGLLIKEGSRYLTNIVLITDELRQELRAKTSDGADRIADIIAAAITENEDRLRGIGFSGCKMGANSFAWQMSSAILYKAVVDELEERIRFEHPKNQFGTECVVWGVENEAADAFSVGISNAKTARGDRIRFVDFPINGEMAHHVVYEISGADRLLCRIARGESTFSENDREIIAELIRRGIVKADGDGFAVNAPVFTAAQFGAFDLILDDAVKAVADETEDMMETIETILQNHTPKHLEHVCKPLAYLRLLDDVISCSAAKLFDRKLLLPYQGTDLLPTTVLVLNQ